MQSWHKQSGNWLYYGNNDIDCGCKIILHPNKYIYNQNLSKWHKFIYCRLSLLQIPITTSKWRGIFAYNATKPLYGNASINLMHKYVLVDFIIVQLRQRKKKAGRYQRDCKMHLHDLGWGKKVQWPWTLIYEEITVVYDCSFICTLSNLSIRLQFM